VPLVTQDGKMVRFYDDLLKGKAVVINLIYTSCKDVCPLETAKLREVQRLLGDRVGKEIFFYSISIDPKHDTPPVLKAYAERFHVGPGWTFLTGKKADIDLIGRKLGLTSLTDADNADGHQASLMIGNEATGQWMRNSAVDNPRFLAMTIENSLNLRSPRKPVKNYTEAPRLAHLNAGEYLFQTKCSACHTVGKGEGLGPDLLGVTHRRDRAWLTRFIATPDRLLAENDPLATALYAEYRNLSMPNLRLGPSDVDSLLEYLEAQTAARARPAGTVQAAGLHEAGSAQIPAHAHHHAHGGASAGSGATDE
jgi:protein SCO1